MAFTGIPMAAPVAAPQAGINYSPMDQIANLVTQLPLLAKLFAGNQNQQNPQGQGQPQQSLTGQLVGAQIPATAAAPAGAASPTTAGALTTGNQAVRPTPVSYAGTGYNPQMMNQIPRIGPYGAQGPGAMPGQNPQAIQTLIQMLQSGSSNPYSGSSTPYAGAPAGFGSGLRNPAAGY